MTELMNKRKRRGNLIPHGFLLCKAPSRESTDSWSELVPALKAATGRGGPANTVTACDGRIAHTIYSVLRLARPVSAITRSLNHLPHAS